MGVREWCKIIPSVDYKVTNDPMFVKIGTEINTNDQIDLSHPKFVTKFGFRQFKDMTHQRHLEDWVMIEDIILHKH